MENAEASLESTSSVAETLRLVIQIEASEINLVFKGIVAASDSEFIRKLRAFQTAGEKHISFICREIPKLDPELAEECQTLNSAVFGQTGK